MSFYCFLHLEILGFLQIQFGFGRDLAVSKVLAAFQLLMVLLLWRQLESWEQLVNGCPNAWLCPECFRNHFEIDPHWKVLGTQVAQA